MLRLALWTAATWAVASAASSQDYATKSGIKLWVDPATPEERQTYTSSRGRSWDLVMSDEFNTANRSFKPGVDHLWTSLEKPDGVNGALEIYSHNMTSTACDDDGTCYFFIKVEDEVTTVHVYNAYLNPPAYQDVDFFYRAAMVQSWNKFCFQGGMMEVRAQLPGAVESASGNPDLALGSSGQVTTGKFYPTWPGIWMLGNLGRAIFSASTNRMWPFSYDKCDPDVFEPTNQRISACDDNPGYGMNPNQGRGAPEIDILEGGGTAISSSLQIAPGMPTDYRLFPADTKGADETNPYCVYSYNCETPGANYIDVPTAYYESERGHKSWYQGLRYAANNFCKGTKSSEWTQTYASVSAAIEKGITQNTCSAATCPASGDVNGDLDVIDGVGSDHWGINTNGTCYPMMNSYMGAYLCDPDNMDEKCSSPRNASTPKTNTMPTFSYQMDAISSNWPVHLGAYTSFLTYQLEWVTGKAGYVRWMLEGHPIFEVTTDAFSNVPQNSNKTNPEKVMLEEPMYVIFNVALSRSWGVSPPNAGSPCRGDGTDATNNAICDSFPMYMKIDYIRLYQDLGDDLPDDQYMQIGCDPKSHPTKGWIEGHITEYVDDDNPMKTVLGGAFCSSDLDCTIGSTTGNSTTTKRSTTNKLVTGKCVKSRCSCSTSSWGGPRCTTALGESEQSGSLSTRVYGPPMGLSLGVAGIVVVCSFVAVYMSVRALSKEADAALKAAEAKAGAAAASPKANNLDVSYSNIQPKDNYSQNFV